MWNERPVLTWDDFKASPDPESPFAANTNSGISFTWNYSTSKGQPELIHQVFSNFYPQYSWVKSSEKDAYLLAHEQAHFDISEIYARKLRKALQEYEIGRNIRRDLNGIYQKMEKQRDVMQRKFDKETDHSENTEAEMKWRKFITTELERLEAYSK
ncbi:DUF922 domain-containing protein [Gramella sp. AN32]|nr:DUF922 domain-containing protein [Gramella sp. AN32]